jgi:hypothetical protein
MARAVLRPKIKGGGNAAARALGKLGGVKGGPARAKALPAVKKSKIASHAAKKRWGKPSNYSKPEYYKRATKPYPARP